MISYHEVQVGMGYITSLKAIRPQQHHTIHDLKTSTSTSHTYPTTHIYPTNNKVPKGYTTK